MNIYTSHFLLLLMVMTIIVFTFIKVMYVYSSQNVNIVLEKCIIESGPLPHFHLVPH